MAEFISVKDALKKGTGTAKLRGWVYRERGSAKLKFIVLRDSSDIIQCVIKADDFPAEKFKEADKILIESSIELEGELHKDERAPTGYELRVKDFKVIHFAETFPITSKDQSPEFLFDIRHLALRTRRITAILKIRDTVFEAFREYFRSKGFYEYHSPIFQSTQCEGGSTLFKVDYFGKPVFLSQSWQLYAEPAIFALEKIFTISPSFRAERSKTARHLTEYWHAEMEEAWATFADLQDHGEAVIKHMVKKVLEKHKDELKILERDTKTLEASVKKPFPRMTYTDALKILKEKCKIDIPWGKDLRSIEEDKISQLYDTPILITHYPKEVKAFYMKQAPEDPRTVRGYDCIAPESYGEVIGGSERETDIEVLKKKLKDMGEKVEDYSFYLDTRRYGSVPHGGFGLGMERVVSWICGLESIKDAIPFPRTMHRVTP